MGNGFAYFMLFFWPIVALYLYSTMSAQKATIWTILGGFMFLPVRTTIDLPFIPPLGKQSIPVLSALIGCRFIANKRIGSFYGSGVLKLLIILYIISPIFTVINNSEVVIAGGNVIPGLNIRDAFSFVINRVLFICPLFIGRSLFRSYEDQLLLFKTLVFSGLIYSIFIIFEVRMSPQLHTWVYGYFPHSFLQQYRYGGFRPVVFMGHGLWVAFYVVAVLVSSFALWKVKVKVNYFFPKKIYVYFWAILVLCKSAASLMYGLFVLSVIKFFSPKRQLRFAVLLSSLALLYPTLSIMDFFPHEGLIKTVLSLDAERAESLEFRFDNENILLERARDKFFFGWGGWGRNRVYNDETGRDESVTDGRWIITFGLYGAVGFFAEFWLLAIGVFNSYKVAKYIKSKQEYILLSAHALLVGIIMIDQLPNATLDPWLWLISGILLGRSENILKQKVISKNRSSQVSRGIHNI